MSGRRANRGGPVGTHGRSGPGNWQPVLTRFRSMYTTDYFEGFTFTDQRMGGRRRRSMVWPMVRPCLLAAVAATALSACSAASIDTAKVEKAIEAKFDPFSVSSVTCPEDVKPVKGGSFTCSATVEGADIEMQVTQDDDKGNVTFAPKGELLDVAKISETVKSGIKEQLGFDVTVDCGTSKLLLKQTGDTFTCSTTDGVDTRDVSIIVGTGGSVEWKL
jgi:Domain of unknown function (DUF4333)